MKSKLYSTSILALGLALAPIAYAADDDTIIVLDHDGAPEDVAHVIALPADAADAAHEHAAMGMDTANSAYELQREFGEQMADGASDHAIGEAIRDAIRDEARDHGDVPDQPPTDLIPDVTP